MADCFCYKHNNLAVSFSFLFPEKLYRFNTELERSRAGFVSKMCTAGDHTIRYLESGSGTETVVLLHGFDAEKDNWNLLGSYMKGYHLVVPDIPG